MYAHNVIIAYTALRVVVVCLIILILHWKLYLIKLTWFTEKEI